MVLSRQHGADYSFVRAERVIQKSTPLRFAMARRSCYVMYSNLACSLTEHAPELLHHYYPCRSIRLASFTLTAERVKGQQYL